MSQIDTIVNRVTVVLLLAFITVFLVLSLAFNTGQAWAQGQSNNFELDPFYKGVVKGDPQATFELAIANFLQDKPNLPYKYEHFNCYEIVGYECTMRYTDANGEVQNFERTTGLDGMRAVKMEEAYYEETGTVTTENQYGEPVESDEIVVVGAYYFKGMGLAKCADPDLKINADDEQINVDEKTRITLDFFCGKWPMEAEVELSLEGVGELVDSQLKTDINGKAATTFHGNTRGTATITAKATNCSMWKDDATEITDRTKIRVGAPGMAIDLTYNADQNMGFFSSKFEVTNHVSMPLKVDDAGNVTGEGSVETAWDFHYEGEQARSENFQATGFDSCTAEGHFANGEYTFTIKLSGTISYEHVIDGGPRGQFRIPISTPVMWEQYFAEPIVIGASKDSTFEASGSIPMSPATYTIRAHWENSD